MTTGDATVQMRFLFEAPSLRLAGDLAASLRMCGRNRVQVRHATPRHWTVIATTPPKLAGYPSVAFLEREMEDVARRHAGCRVVGWTRVPPTD